MVVMLLATAVALASMSSAGFASCLVFLLMVSVPRLLLEAAGYAWAYARLADLASETTYSLDESRLRISARRGEVSRHWSTLRCYRETADALVLFGRAGGVLVLPKRAFDFDLTGLRGFLRRHLEESSPGSPARSAALVALGVVLFLSLWHFVNTDLLPGPRPVSPGATSE